MDYKESNLLSNNIKNKIIEYLYSFVDLSKHRYSMLSLDKLKYLQECEHYVALNYKGFNYFLIMLEIENKKYNILIDKKKLSYYKNQLDINAVRITQINMNLTESNELYNGSIFSGKLIQSTSKSIFIIQDCFYLSGKNLLKLDMMEKINKIDYVINNFLKKYCKNFEFKINTIYKYNDLNNLINNILPKSIVSTQGIIFYPKISGNTIIFLGNNDNKKIDYNTNNNEIIEQSSYHIIYNFVDFLKSRTYSYENGVKKVLWLSKTDIIDVYNIHENELDDKQGIALIPCLKISHMCKDNIINKPIQFNCVYSIKFKKWIPISIYNK